MHMYDLLRKKRCGLELADEEIRFFVRGLAAGEVPDDQAAALCMAVCTRGMSDRETVALTLAIRDSGRTLRLPDGFGPRVDKHSTGGVGDKTSLVVVPLVASLGLRVVKMSGRSLGHTGGTLDKLEAIPGLRTEWSIDDCLRIAEEAGAVIFSQSEELAPADKKLYALRDRTATVDSLPLIASSIMGKKLAADDDAILLDVKCGSGAFLKSEEQARELARVMVGIGRAADKKTRALVTDMDRPLGRAVGNALEVAEAIDTLAGGGPEDLRELCTALAWRMLVMAGAGDRASCERRVRQALADGSALAVFARMIEAQGGDPACCSDTSLLPRAPLSRRVLAPRGGYIRHTDTEAYGRAALALGAGRAADDGEIDLSAVSVLQKKTGDTVRTGDVLATLFAASEERLDEAEAILLGATVFSDMPAAPRKLILDEIV